MEGLGSLHQRPDQEQPSVDDINPTFPVIRNITCHIYHTSFKVLKVMLRIYIINSFLGSRSIVTPMVIPPQQRIWGVTPRDRRHEYMVSSRN